MDKNGLKRKLTAILSADVEGYSRLMGEHEVSTIHTLTAYKEAMTALIKHHRGRVVDSPGDNLLAEFASVVDAVQCAVEIQRDLAKRNEELPENRKMLFRIGVNIGDVVEEKDRIYGDGVNIAARLESLSEAGGVCISRAAYDQVKNKLPYEYSYEGEQIGKNIKEPLQVYKVVPDSDTETNEVTGIESLELPDKPSIAVLPFDNMSGDPNQEYLADGITDQIITGLSMMPYIFVIARNSSFTYKGQPVKVQQVAQELGVQFVLEGSVQQSGNRIRVTAQLNDALTGRHVWSERYDRMLEDIFAVQDEIMVNIMRAMEVSVVGIRILEDQPTPQCVEAYLKILKALELVFHWNMDDNLSARKLYEEAIGLDPEYGPAYVLLGFTYYHEAYRGWCDDPAGSLEKAKELGKKATTHGGSLGHMLLMSVYERQGGYDRSIAEAEKGLALNPNSADFNAVFAVTLMNTGKYKEAIKRVKKAIRLNPHHPPWVLTILGGCYLRAGMNEEAIEVYERDIKQAPDTLHSWLSLASLYAQMGRDEEAKKAAEEVHRIAPDYSWGKYGKVFYRFNDKEIERKFFDGLHKFGLK